MSARDDRPGHTAHGRCARRRATPWREVIGEHAFLRRAIALLSRSTPTCAMGTSVRSGGRRAIFLPERYVTMYCGRALLIEHPNRGALAIAARRGTKGNGASIEYHLPVDAPDRADGFVRRLGAA